MRLSSLLLLTSLSFPGGLLAAALPVEKVARLPAALEESSGLARAGSDWISHNDSGDQPRLFRFGPDGQGAREYRVAGADAVDWEDVASNRRWLFIADTGNNLGMRRDLRIYRLPLSQLEQGGSRPVNLDKIYPIRYADQTVFIPTLNATRFDMEAMAVVGDELWLMSKDWQEKRSRLYRLPISGNGGSLTPAQEWRTDCLITGADYEPSRRRMAMVGYRKGRKGAPPCLWIVPVTPRGLAMAQGVRYDLARTGQFEAVAWADPDTLLLTREKQTSLYRVRLPLPKNSVR